MTPSERLAQLADGRDPLLIMRLKSGFAVMSHTQFLKGYCLLLAYPQVEALKDLPMELRMAFLYDMALVGDAVQRATNCDRVNYGIYGNQDLFLHAHIVPRFNTEMAPFNIAPPLSYPEEIRDAEEHQFDDKVHRHLQATIHQHLQDVIDRQRLAGHLPHYG